MIALPQANHKPPHPPFNKDKYIPFQSSLLSSTTKKKRGGRPPLCRCCLVPKISSLASALAPCRVFILSHFSSISLFSFAFILTHLYLCLRAQKNRPKTYNTTPRRGAARHPPPFFNFSAPSLLCGVRSDIPGG